MVGREGGFVVYRIKNTIQTVQTGYGRGGGGNWEAGRGRRPVLCIIYGADDPKQNVYVAAPL